MQSTCAVLLLFIWTVLGVQRPTRILRGPNHRARPLARGELAGSDHDAAVVGTPQPSSQQAKNLYYVIEGKSLHTWEQQDRSHDMHHPGLMGTASPDVYAQKDREFEVGITGDAQQSSLATGMDTVPHAILRDSTSAKVSLLDISSDQLRGDQVPTTTGVAVLTTAAAAPLATAAPAPVAVAPVAPAPVAAAPVPAAPAAAVTTTTAVPAENHRLSIFVLFAILLIVTVIALGVAYYFLVRHRRHGLLHDPGTSSQSPNNYSKRREQQRRRPSALLADGLISPRDVKDTRVSGQSVDTRASGQSLNNEPARDRNLDPPPSATLAPPSAVIRASSDPRSPTSSREKSKDMLGAASMPDPRAASSTAQVVGSNAEIPKLNLAETPSPTPQLLAAPVATAASAEASGSKQNQQRPASGGDVEATPSNERSQNVATLESPGVSPSVAAAAVASDAESLSASAAADAADAAAGGGNSTYAAKRKERRSVRTERAQPSVDSHSTEETPKAPEQGGDYAAERRKSRREAAGASKRSSPTQSETETPKASRRSRSAYAESRRSRLTKTSSGEVPEAPATPVVSSQAWPAGSAVQSTSDAANSSGGPSGPEASKPDTPQRSPSTLSVGAPRVSQRKSLGRLMAQQNTKAQPQEDDEELMF